jgi:hypothetical protein
MMINLKIRIKIDRIFLQTNHNWGKQHSLVNIWNILMMI